MKNEETKGPWNRHEILSFIERSHVEIREDALCEAVNLAEANASSEVVHIYATGVTAKYQGVISTVRQHTQAKTHRAHLLLHQNIAETEIEENNQKRKEAQHVKQVGEADKRRMKSSYNWNKLWWLVPVGVLIIIGDAAFNMYSFAVLGGALIFAGIVALIYSGCLAKVAFEIPRHIQRLESAQTRRHHAILIGLGMLLVFIVAGILRSEAVLGTGRLSSLYNGNVILGIIIFTILSAVLFIASIFFFKAIPTDQDWNARKAERALNKKIKEAEKTISNLETANRNVTNGVNQQKHEYVSRTGDELHYEAHIKNFCRKTLTDFFHELNLKRPTGTTPLLPNADKLIF